MNVIVCQSELSIAPLKTWCKWLSFCGQIEEEVPVVVIDVYEHSKRGITFTELFERIVKQLEKTIQSDGCMNVLLDGISDHTGERNSLSLVSSEDDSANIIAMLIMLYPDISWTILEIDPIHSRIPERNRFPNSLVEFCCFDPAGLRDLIRDRTNEDLARMAKEAVKRTGREHAPFQLPRRRERAVVIEDEEDFALLYGYTAYKFGFRTEVVSSWQHMQEVFGQESPGRDQQGLLHEALHPYRLIIEDMRLQFADKPASKNLSSLEDRAKHCPLLSNDLDHSDFRFLITTGQQSDGDFIVRDNQDWLYNKSHGIGKVLFKPIGGPLEFWREAGLNRALDGGVATGFVSPPEKVMDDLYGGHGAPGKLALVAKKLIDRARRVAADAATPREFILSAVLANDAFELLGGKTPTLALEALKIRVTSEVKAECAFVGAGFHIELDDRYAEIERDVRSVCRWYRKRDQKWCEWDAQAAIYNELVKVYREAGQMEEENKCLVKFRKFNRKLDRPRNVLSFQSRWNPFAWAFHGVMAYAEFLLVSLPRITISFALWIAFFTFLGWALVGSLDDRRSVSSAAKDDQSAVVADNFQSDSPLNDAIAPNIQGEFRFGENRQPPQNFLARQLNWMIGGGAHEAEFESQESQARDAILVWLSIFSNIIGVFHFSILMSFMYSLISRK